MSHPVTQSATELQTRIEELETKITFQDHLIEELNQALIEQQSDLRKLTRVLENVVSQVEQIDNGASNDNQTEIPPHY
jgi:SlyX protein